MELDMDRNVNSGKVVFAGTGQCSMSITVNLPNY
jgi:hypothetical protein